MPKAYIIQCASFKWIHYDRDIFKKAVSTLKSFISLQCKISGFYLVSVNLPSVAIHPEQKSKFLSVAILIKVNGSGAKVIIVKRLCSQIPIFRFS